MNIVITGFKSFLNHQINPSEVLVKKLYNYFNLKDIDSDKSLNSSLNSSPTSSPNKLIYTRVLSVEFSNAFLQLNDLISQLTNINKKPDFVIMLGLAADRKEINFEKIALNWQQTKNSDEAGFKPSSGPIIPNQDLAVMSPFPIEEALNYLNIKSVKPYDWALKTSFSAGTYVCNDLYYRQLQANPEINSVFIHIPLFEVISEEIQFQFLLRLIEFLIKR